MIDRNNNTRGGTPRGYSDLTAFYGDLHNHCGVSYAHGTLEEAYANAELQLDFVSVTGHAAWPDMDDRPMPRDVVEYHRNGFRKLARQWEHYCDVTEGANRPGSFTTFFGYEFHSFRHGDRTCVSPCRPDAPDPEMTTPAFEDLLRRTDARRDHLLLLPHHIGYARGFRGVNWDSVTDSATPIVEILSMHGLAERDGQWFPYLHTMGPLDPRQTMVAGLQQGHHFGVVGSTDHHSAHPGSYGHGKTVVWARECTREAIWEAIVQRRTYAVSGDRIELQFSLNGYPMGSRDALGDVPGERTIEVAVRGGDRIARVEVIRNGSLLYTHTPGETRESTHETYRGKVLVEMGWGEKGQPFDWDVDITVDHGKLLAVEPRLRGRDVVDPLDTSDGPCHFSRWTRTADTVHLTTRTFGNATTATSQTQAICLDVAGTGATTITVRHSTGVVVCALEDLHREARVAYTSGFVSPALRIHRFIREESYTAAFTCVDHQSARADSAPPTDQESQTEDFYYVRVIQENGHGAWSSPIWIPSAGRRG